MLKDLILVLNLTADKLKRLPEIKWTPYF